MRGQRKIKSERERERGADIQTVRHRMRPDDK